MSLRSAVTRAPAKRMLVYFEKDSSTSILSTKKVKKIVDGNKLEDGVVVLVDYDNVDYEALVIKLHDDPTVLSQFETTFLKSQQFEDDGKDKDGDKENNSKRPKLSSAPKPLKQKDKPKKIISIEAETAPTAESWSVLPAPSPNENKPGSLNFLDAIAQVKVQKLLNNFLKEDGKDVSTQTELQSVELPQKKASGEKFVQTEASVPICQCKQVMSTLNMLSEKMDGMKSLQLTFLSRPGREELFNNEDSFVVGYDSDLPFVTPPVPFSTTPVPFSTTPVSTPPVLFSTTNQFSTTAAAVPCSTASVPFSTTPFISARPSMSPEFEVLQEHNPAPSFRSAVFEETFKESSSMYNYAKNLTFKLFVRHELHGSNCAGVKGKRSLEKDQRMDTIKDAIFRKYSVEDKKKSWASCRKAIDSAIRHLKPYN